MRATAKGGRPDPAPKEARQPRAAPPDHPLVALQRAAGNHAVARALPLDGPPAVAVLQRLQLEDGPPLAPGNFRYGSLVLGLDPGSVKGLLTDKAGKEGLEAERTWKRTFADEMRQTAKPHKYDDPVAKQTVSVEPTLATNADNAQQQIDQQARATEEQFQQRLVVMIRGMLDASEQKLMAEAQRYGFPTVESILAPQPVSAGQAEVQGLVPGADEVRGLAKAAGELLSGRKKLNTAKAKIAAMGPILGDASRPTVLEPAVEEYHKLRSDKTTKYPLLASVERNEQRMSELASAGAAPTTGPAGAVALQKAREEARKEIADKLANIATVREGTKEQDKVDRFWLNPSLRAQAKQGLAIAPGTVNDAAVEDRVRRLKEDAEFEQKIKNAIGIALLVASVVPGVAPFAGAAGIALAGVDLSVALQQYYWEEAAAGSAMEKAEAISQEEPSLYGLGVSLALGLLEGVAEVKALEKAIAVFKAVKGAYREARAAAVAAKVARGSGGAAATDAANAIENLRTTTEQASGRPEVGAKVVASLQQSVGQEAMSLDKALRTIKDPTLKELVLKSTRNVSPEGTLMDLAIKNPAELEADYREWRKQGSGGTDVTVNGKKAPTGKSFEDWLADIRTPTARGTVTDPGGLVEYGLNPAEAHRSYESFLRDDPSREVGMYRDAMTGEHVVVQGGAEFVGHEWMADKDGIWSSHRPLWELVQHHHPNRGVALDRLPSTADYGVLYGQWVASLQRGRPLRSVSSVITWQDPATGLRYTTNFGMYPGGPTPYWMKVTVSDGTYRTFAFKDPPWATGQSTYLDFVRRFTGDAANPVQGGAGGGEVATGVAIGLTGASAITLGYVAATGPRARAAPVSAPPGYVPATASNGRAGFVKESDLVNAVSGRPVPVFASDGATQVGELTLKP